MSHPFPNMMYRPESTKVAYMRLIQELDKLGMYTIEEKKTFLHFIVSRFVFLEAQPRPGGIRISLVLNRRLQGRRIFRSEQVSAIAFQNDVDINIPQDFDAELVAWLQEAYALRATPKVEAPTGQTADAETPKAEAPKAKAPKVASIKPPPKKKKKKF